MKFKKELTLRGELKDLSDFLKRVENSLGNGWKRDRQVEERRGWRDPWGPYCFSCTAKADRPAAGLWVYPRSYSEFYVSDVIPLEKHYLEEEEKNNLLEDFARELLLQAPGNVEIKTEMVQQPPLLEKHLSGEALQLLREFSASANRNSLPRNDRKRWNAFLVQAHQEEALYEPGLLDEWLQQEGWPEGMRQQLLREYELAYSLFSTYDEMVERR